MKTRKYLDNKLKELLEKSDLNPEFEPIIKELQQNIAERDALLLQNGEPWDEEQEDFEFTPKAQEAAPDEEYKAKYEEMRKRYVDTFLYGDDGAFKPMTPSEPKAVDEPTPAPGEDTGPLEIDDLFTEVE